MPGTDNETELRRQIANLQQRVVELEETLGEHKRIPEGRHSTENALARQEAELRATLYGIGDAVIATGREGRVARMNPVAEQLTGWTEAEAVGQPLDVVFYIVNEETRRQVESPVARVLRENTVIGLTNHTLLISKDGREIPIADSGAPIFDLQDNITGVVLVFRDQTEERLTQRLLKTRLSLIEYATSHTLDELLTRALDEVGTFVDSPIGFYHFVEANQKTLALQQWSTRTLKEFCQAEGKGLHYDIDQAGVWVECVYEKKPVVHNDYASLPHKKGMPEGHAEVIRELVVPVMREDRVVAILGVGNKPTEYTQKDVEIVSYLADVTWEIVRQKRAEEVLRWQNEYLAALQETTLELLSQLDLDILLENIVRRAGLLLGTSSGYLDLMEPETGQLKPRAGLGALAESLRRPVQPGEGVAGTVWQTGQPLVVNDYDNWPGRVDGYTPGILSSIICAPLLSGGQVLGVLGLGHEFATQRAFEQKDVEILAQFARLAVIAIENARLFSAAMQELAERKKTQEKIKQSESKYRMLVESTNSFVFSLDAEGKFDFVNRFWSEKVGYSAKEIIGTNGFDLITPESGKDVKPKFAQVLRGDFVGDIEFRSKTKENGFVDVLVNLTPIWDSSGKVTHMLGTGIDITERKQTEEEKARLEEQIHQFQKLESIGRLAGGVAHDFNNMLSVILGHTEMAVAQVNPAQPLFADLEEIRKAAERSANLTRQLLAFARKQTIAPQVLDLNETVEGMLKMLRRLIGEEIDLAWLPRTDLRPVKMDPSQIDQILANLCINARDAIEDVGKITIETDTVIFDEAYCDDHAGFVPGEFVLLAVSDDGCGMDKETLDNIFEPFFTTKGMDRGSGLGLATVYGIVRQNSGFINVYSEPGQGTTFRIYLPRHGAKTEQMGQESPVTPAERGHETILLVEDESAILDVGRLMLERFGYRVLPASTPSEAIQVAREYAGEIHLLITDVVMPKMNGRDLAEKLISLYPEVRRLFMSGYTADVIAHHGILDEGVNFIQKPFSMRALAAKVREVLDGT